MLKISLKSILATLNTASAAMQEQANASIAALTEETSADQRKRTQRAAQNLAKVSEAQKTSTTHDEETRKLIELLARKDVASFVRENGIDANAFLQHAKYGKAKLNAVLDEVARGIVPDPTKNATNAVCIMELLKKSGANQFNVLTVQRFLQHAGDTQAGYIFRFWKEFGNARVTGSKNDRVLKLDESNPLTIAIAKLYGIEFKAHDESAASA